MRRRSRIEVHEVPFLPEKRIEQEAALLLAEYGQACGEVAGPPVPIDEIIELHLGLTFEFKDMQTLFGHADVHGALWLKERLVGVDTSLDPAVHPRRKGRYHYTLAHEAGHWRLHRAHYVEDPNQGALFAGGLGKPAYVCRSSDKRPVEWQADRFASHLLMPHDMVLASWREWRGDLAAVFLDELEKDDAETPEEALKRFCRPLADRFQVSGEAMRIRLENLGLLGRERSSMLF
ncbi:MAG: ImmA/IrrE family metallo-endopeptidase [Planctomycetota bacterium]|nr:ImmA/IrrE family metallo-endopeptidase [Planctomycetota bacterium]